MVKEKEGSNKIEGNSVLEGGGKSKVSNNSNCKDKGIR